MRVEPKDILGLELASWIHFFTTTEASRGLLVSTRGLSLVGFDSEAVQISIIFSNHYRKRGMAARPEPHRNGEIRLQCCSKLTGQAVIDHIYLTGFRTQDNPFLKPALYH